MLNRSISRNRKNTARPVERLGSLLFEQVGRYRRQCSLPRMAGMTVRTAWCVCEAPAAVLFSRERSGWWAMKKWLPWA